MIRWLQDRWGELQALRKLKRYKLNEIPLEELKEDGIELLLLDVDNTIAPWNEHPTNEASAFILRAIDMDFDAALVSNVVIERRAGRVEGMAKDFELKCVCAHLFELKPRRFPFRKALELIGIKPDKAAMIGDQLFTDMWGAIRAGIKPVWVEPVGNDHPATWFLRWLEKLFTDQKN